MYYTSNNPPFVVMPSGVWHLYSAQYRHGLTLFSVEFYARNDDEAAAMLASMRNGLRTAERVVALFGGHRVGEN